MDGRRQRGRSERSVRDTGCGRRRQLSWRPLRRGELDRPQREFLALRGRGLRRELRRKRLSERPLEVQPHHRTMDLGERSQHARKHEFCLPAGDLWDAGQRRRRKHSWRPCRRARLDRSKRQSLALGRNGLRRGRKFRRAQRSLANQRLDAGMGLDERQQHDDQGGRARRLWPERSVRISGAGSAK